MSGFTVKLKNDIKSEERLISGSKEYQAKANNIDLYIGLALH